MNDSNKPDYIPSFAEIRATLAEVAARQKENEALSKESWRQILELKAQMAKTDAQMAENAVQMAENAVQMAENAVQMAKTSKDIDKLSRSVRELHSHIKNDADACEQRFIDGLKLQNLVIAGVTFDDIYSNQTKDRRGHHIELDALLVNGDSIAIMEVKKRLHVNDVIKVRDNLIARFRHMYPEHQDKRLMVLVAGENINDDAATAALEAGFVILSFKTQELQIRNSQPRYY